METAQSLQLRNLAANGEHSDISNNLLELCAMGFTA